MMTRKTALFLGVLAFMTLVITGSAQAGQCRDPWVTQAIQQVTGRAPTGNHESGDCNIRNFNGGSWNSYPELVGYVQKYAGARNYAANPAALAGNANRPSVAAGNLLNNPNTMVAAGAGNLRNKNSLIGDGGGT